MTGLFWIPEWFFAGSVGGEELGLFFQMALRECDNVATDFTD